MAILEPGQIVIADWRDVLPKGPNQLRPTVVIQDSALFDTSYPNVILVPLTKDANMVLFDLSVRIEPSPQDACTKVCFTACALAAGTSRSRVRSIASRIVGAQLACIRCQVAEAIGLI